MIEKKTLTLFLFSIFVWAHLIPSLYPSPWHTKAEQRVLAERFAENEEKYVSSLPKEKRFVFKSAEKWERAIYKDQRKWWFIAFLIFSLGFVSSVSLLLSCRYWPWLTLIPATAVFLMSGGSTLYGYYVAGFVETSKGYFNLLFLPEFASSRSAVIKGLYFSIVWPMLAGILVVTAIGELRRRRKTNAA